MDVAGLVITSAIAVIGLYLAHNVRRQQCLTSCLGRARRAPRRRNSSGVSPCAEDRGYRQPPANRRPYTCRSRKERKDAGARNSPRRPRRQRRRASLAFYLELLGPFGLAEDSRFPTYRGTQEAVYLRYGDQLLGLRPADGGEHHYYEVGIEHIAFYVDTRAEVDERTSAASARAPASTTLRSRTATCRLLRALRLRSGRDSRRDRLPGARSGLGGFSGRFSRAR